MSSWSLFIKSDVRSAPSKRAYQRLLLRTSPTAIKGCARTPFFDFFAILLVGIASIL